MKVRSNRDENPLIVTAFFDIGRGDMNYKNCEPRSFQKYLEYFRFWARVKNHLVVFTQVGLSDKIMEVRRNFGLELKTTIIEIENIFDCERELYEKMKKIEQNEDFKKFRFFESEVSNTAAYDYIMLMKYYSLKEAATKFPKYNNLIWMDFGFNHGGQCLSKSEEFDFKVSCDMLDKISLYSLPDKQIDKISLIDSLQYQIDHIAGDIIVTPTNLAKDFYDKCTEAMKGLILLGCIDDDQQLLLMAYRSTPELFIVKEADWFLPLKEYLGGQHLSVVDSFVNRKQPPQDERSSLRRYIGRIKRYLLKKNIDSDDFMARVDEKCRRYWPYR